CGVRIAGPAEEVDVVHGVRLADERSARAELGRGRSVQQQADLDVVVRVAQAVPQRLDRVADRVRVPEVDEQRAWQGSIVPTQAEKGLAFQAVHEGEAFVIPNPWDAGSARMLEALGFQALATTSGGFAFTLGRLDGTVKLDEVVAHVSALAGATDLPVSVDLETGFGAEPEAAERAIERVAEAGAVGGSIEDWDPAGRLYDPVH